MSLVQSWLETFTTAVASGDGAAVAELFQPAGFWRDYLPFGWTLNTLEGTAAITDFATRHGAETGFADARFTGKANAAEGFFQFCTLAGNGQGYIRLQGGKCMTLFTMLDDLTFAKPDGHASQQENAADPLVLVIGGGQSGLALGAQLNDLGVSYLIVDKRPRIGDQWRSRYASLILHDPVWYDHMPFIPFPDDWPIFTPKDKMGDWLENYAQRLSLNIQTDTELIDAEYDDASESWSVTLQQGGEISQRHPKHLVFALGISGFPKVPVFSGQNDFQGMQCHSSDFVGGSDYAAKNVVIVGANNSAHDIAADLVTHDAYPVIIQRSSTLVVRQEDYCSRLLGVLYSRKAVENGITTERADILTASTPLRLLEQQHRLIWDDIQRDRKDYYAQIAASGFRLDFAEDGTGLGMKYRRTASGYYIDVGAGAMVADGRIGVRAGTGVDRLTRNGVRLDTGEVLPADAIVYATGFGTMTDWVAALISPAIAARVGPCWGYGSGTKGDPGPWIGELRNMWVPTAQPGLWFMGGNLAQARFYSRLLALQLKRKAFAGNKKAEPADSVLCT